MGFKLNWDEPGERFYETGVSRGVLYVKEDTESADTDYGAGVEWNGLTNVTESPEGAEATAIYADNIKYLNLISVEEFKATVEAYTYPDAFAACDGSAAVSSAVGLTATQQTRKQFALCYRTEIGNDETPEKGYKIHLVYGCLAAPSERAYGTINDSPEAITFSWEISTTPIETGIAGLKPTAHFEIDSTKFTTTAEKALLTALENFLYGTAAEGSTQAVDAKIPTISKLVTLLTPVP